MGDPYFIFYQSAMSLSLLVSLSVVALTLAYHRTNGAKAMMALAGATFIWTLGFLLETNSNTLGRQLLFDKIGYLGLMTVPVAWFVFAVNYSSGNRIITWRKLPLLFIFPLATVVLIWTNDCHHLMWFNEHLTETGPFTLLDKTYGTFFWISVAHNYILITTATVILLRRLFVGTPLYKWQAVSLVVAVSLPLIWNVIYVFDLVPGLHKDFTPLMFAISGMAVILGLLRFQLFRTVPFAYKFLVHQLSDGILVFNRSNCLIEANPMALKILGADRNIIGKGIESLYPLSSIFQQLLSLDSGSIELPFTIEGEERIYEVKKVPMSDDHSRPVGWMAILNDITERKQAEAALRESEEKIRRTLASVQEGVIVFDLKGKIIDVNDGATHMHGYDTKEELIGQNWSELVAARDHVKVEEDAKKTLEEGNIGITLYTLVKKDGSEFLAAASSAVLRDTTGQSAGFVILTTDVTEQQKRQDQLIITDRLASIGQLAAGIAHEINNPLTSVIGFSELVLKRKPPDEIRADLEIIGKEARRVAEVVKGLLTFARSKGSENELMDINSIIQEILHLRSYEQSTNNIEVDISLASGLPKVIGNGAQMQQVFINLIINAEQAMLEAHKRGRLKITTEEAMDMVRVSISDDGPGISQENMKKLFTPFFTTKEVGKGTGLGLSICHGIVTGYGGRIYAESQPGQGATFIVELPIPAGTN